LPARSTFFYSKRIVCMKFSVFSETIIFG
jgi:hypothetical protein